MFVFIYALALQSLPSADLADVRHIRSAAAFQLDPDDDDARPKSGRRSSSARPDDDDGDDEEGRAQPDSEIVVSARALDAARTQIDAGLGSSVYALTNETIENRPGGETGSLTSVLLQAPGVTSGGNGLQVRGAPANQIRINHVIVPEAISDPADHISARFAETTRLLTGTLPAQFGFAPAGVISVTTKNGLYQHGGEAELFGGSDGTVEPALEWAGSFGHASLFGSGNFEHDRLAVADANGLAARDSRDEFEGLGFADYVLDQSNRVSLLFGGSDEQHHIGATTLPAGTEHTTDAYGVGTLQHSADGLTIQASLFAGEAIDQTHFTGLSRERRSTYGTQVDASANVGDKHTFRFGMLASHGSVRELERSGSITAGSRTSLGLYAQDEWKLTGSLTFNPGVRVEWLRSLNAGATFEPRASLVWQGASGLSAHAGYSRFAAAPPLGEPRNAALTDERDDYVDVGIQQKAGPATFGVDVYSRSARNYLTERATIGSAEASAFAYQRVRIKGIEFSATYALRGSSAWANLSFSSSRGRTILGGATQFAPATLAAAASGFIPLAGEQPFTLSAGATQRIGKLSLSSNIQLSSGAVWTLNSADPNGERHSTYAQLGFAAVYHAHIIGPRTELRLDATNVTNSHAVAADASALEGGWTRSLRDRAVMLGIEQAF
ncbi:MAG: TonB-dependent receptor [Croceibacterium sp.]